MKKTLKISCKKLEELSDIPNFSVMCLQLHDIDEIENKQEVLAAAVQKLRKNGEILIDYINMDRIIRMYTDKEMLYEEVYNKIKQAPHLTKYEDFLEFIDLNNSILIYKVIEQKTIDIVSLLRTGY